MVGRKEVEVSKELAVLKSFYVLMLKELAVSRAFVLSRELVVLKPRVV